MIGRFMALAELRGLADEPQPDMVLLKTDAGSRRRRAYPLKRSTCMQSIIDKRPPADQIGKKSGREMAKGTPIPMSVFGKVCSSSKTVFRAIIW
jgi:hypothetical protein